MILSRRLQHIAKMVSSCKCLADIGTDHGYIPIYAVKNNICEKAIASDINEGPIKSASYNIRQQGLGEKIDTRVGPGLSTLSKGEADCIVIAGMGGNLIGEIINEGIEVAREAKSLVLQPVQYPEALRKSLIDSNFVIIDEDMVKDDNKLYHIIKVQNGITEPYEKEVYYYTGKILLEKGNPLLLEYIEHKIRVLEKIMAQLNREEHSERLEKIAALLSEFREVKACL